MSEMYIRRHPREIEREIISRRANLDALRDLAADCAAIDMRPFVVDPDSLTITYLRDLDIPPNLLAMIAEEASTIATLEHELSA